jgi:D-3-phosphoglycerate dehydrogenase
MKKVLIPTKLDKIAAEILAANGSYQVVQDGKLEILAAAKAHPDAYALIVRSEKVTAEVMDAMPQLKVVIRAGAGYDTIDTKHARKRGIDVMNTPGANANGVAEEVVAMMLADARQVIAADISTRAGKWEKSKFMGREIAGKTIGIVGLGNIGRLVARRLSGFDVTLLGYDPVMSRERAQEINVELTDIPTIFSKCDYVTLHVPENKETKNMVNAALLALVKPGATIINCARSGIIDEAALRAAKAEKNVRFLNDVYPKDAEGEKSVADIADIMLPHIGANTHEANWNAAKRAAEELVDFDFKGVTSYIVNRDIPEGLDAMYCELAYTLAKLCRSLLGPQTALKMVETSFHGQLAAFGEWLMVPTVAGLWDQFDRALDANAARQFLTDRGIEYINRKATQEKQYENSITLDLTSAVDSGTLRKVSVRGTVAEGIQMVSRINEFDKLFFEPSGKMVLFLYEDRPGVLGAIGAKLAAGGINIEDVRNPHDLKTNRSLAIMKINCLPSDELITEISRQIKALAAFSVQL